MDQQQRTINRLRNKAKRQTLSYKDAKERVVAAGIIPTMDNMIKLGNAADSHPMSLRMDPDKVDRWIQSNAP